MKKLFGDSIVARFRALPPIVWVLFAFASFYCAHAYEYLVTGEYVASMYAEAYAELGFDAAKSTVLLGIFASLGEAFFSTLFLEIILAVTYGFVAGRFRAAINKADYKFRVRYLVVLANLLIGILSIGYFFTQKINGVYTPHIRLFTGFVNFTNADNPYYTLQNAVLPFCVYSLFAVVFYGDFRRRFVPVQNQASLFAAYALIYVGAELLIYVVYLVRALLMKDNVFTIYSIIALSIEAGAFVIVGVAYFFYYRYLRKRREEPEPEIKILDDEKPSGNIYDDFGF